MSPPEDDLKATLKRASFYLSVTDARIWLKRGEALGRWLNVWRRRIDTARRSVSGARTQFGAKRKHGAGK